MRIGKKEGMRDTVSFDMTPMIDCCFQLIIFFMLSMKILTPEGDFNVKMPIQASEGVPDPSQLPPIKLRMKSGAKGELTSIIMGTRTLSGNAPFAELRKEIRSIVKDDLGPTLTGTTKQEVELDCDPNLHYEYVVRAITAVSGFVDDNRNVVKMVQKIKFSPRRQE